MFQLLAVHLPQSGDQRVEAQEISVVLEDVSSNPAAICFGRGVRFLYIGFIFIHTVLKKLQFYLWTCMLWIMKSYSFTPGQCSYVNNLCSIFFSMQGEYIASIKCLQLDVFFFRKGKSYRWGWKATSPVFVEMNLKSGQNHTIVTRKRDFSCGTWSLWIL